MPRDVIDIIPVAETGKDLHAILNAFHVYAHLRCGLCIGGAVDMREGHKALAEFLVDVATFAAADLYTSDEEARRALQSQQNGQAPEVPDLDAFFTEDGKPAAN